MMTKDYQRCAQSPCSRDPPGADDENLEGCFSGPSTSPQIQETPRQEGAGRLFCIIGAWDCSQSRVPQTLSTRDIFPEVVREGN